MCLAHFDLEMCFAPQGHAFFRHRNFQKWSEHGVFCTFWLLNVSCATRACTVSTSQVPKVVLLVLYKFWIRNQFRATTAFTFLRREPPKVVRRWRALKFLIFSWVSRHKGIHFFDISSSKNVLNMYCLQRLDFHMCFAAQRGTPFGDVSVQLLWRLPSPLLYDQVPESSCTNLYMRCHMVGHVAHTMEGDMVNCWKR